MTAKIDLYPGPGFANSVELLHHTAIRRQSRKSRPMKLVVYSDGRANEATNVQLIDNDVLSWSNKDGSRGEVPLCYLDRITIWRL